MNEILLMSNTKQKVTMQESFKFPPKILYENRYCNQVDFSVLVCGGKKKKDLLKVEMKIVFIK